ncbi:proton channel OTOP3 isoform X2 [Gracilinanus agilis]|uniref:proton channel OTOP3 isoform X2 n=1 Tax=Gracilinanus agilis TaxID=191870 RepID=UPI001CFCBE77|nr:proton channel OTOP3 isoform X2 [Gracilinanus agilis]
MSEELVQSTKESPQPPGPSPREGWKKGGRMLSVLLSVNVLLLACTLISSGAFNKVAVYDTDVFALLTAMMLLTTSWILFYLFRTSRRPDAVPYLDSHAGPIWLQGGLILFGVCTLVMDVFKTGYYSSFFECQSAIKILHPIIQAVFVIVQTYFLWVSAKDCIHAHLDLTRCGLMFTLTTNLSIWMAAVVDESVHQAHSYSGNSSHARLTSDGESPDPLGPTSCLCLNTTICEVFQKGYLMLYPFSTEYSLICCAILYVMWKNVGRHLSPHLPGPHRPNFHLHGAIFGPLLGFLALVAGVCIFVLFQIQASGPSIGHQYFTLYYAFYVTVLPVMTLACLMGTIMHGLEEREMDTVKNPTRSLDVVLLMGAALGQIGISYFSIVAIVATDPQKQLNRLILAYSILIIIQHIAQNLFIIEGLHRQPLWEGPIQSHHESLEKEECPAGLRRGSVLELGQGLRRVSLAYIHSYSHLNWKRRVLKEISIFLIICNITMWMMPAFGTHPEFENGLEKSFYGYRTWFTIVNFGLPLGVFYRMHSVGGLVEVYLGA